MAKKKVQVDIKYNVNGVDDAVESFEEIGKASDKSAKKVEGLGDNIGDLNGGLGGMIGTVQNTTKALMALIATPAGAVIAAIAVAVGLVAKALQNNEELMNKFKVGLAFLGGLLKPLEKLFGQVFEKIVFAIESPGDAFKELLDFIKTNVTNRFNGFIQFFQGWAGVFVNGWKVLGLNIKKATNDIPFIGAGLGKDALKKLDEDIEKAKDSVKKGVQDMADGLIAVNTGIANATSKIAGFINETKNAANALAELERREQSLLKLRRQVEVQNANALAQLEQLKVIRDDESKSLQQRIDANNKLAQVEKDRINNILALGQKELQLLKDRARIEGPSTERLDAIKEKEIELADLRSQNAGIAAEQVTNDVNLRKEAFEKEAALIEQRLTQYAILEESELKLAEATIKAEEEKLAILKRLGLERNQIYIEQQNNLQTAILEAEKVRRDILAEEQKLAAEQLAEQQKKAAEEEKKAAEEKAKKDLEDAEKLAKQKEEIEKQYQENKAYIIEGGFELANSLAKEGSKEAEIIQKTTALAQLGIDTASAISSLMKASEMNPANGVTFGAAGIAQFAAGAIRIASNIAKASKLLKAPSPNVDASSGSASAPSPDVNGREVGFDGRSAGAERFGAQLPIKAYVTEAEITQSQKNINNIQNLSELG